MVEAGVEVVAMVGVAFLPPDGVVAEIMDRVVAEARAFRPHAVAEVVALDEEVAAAEGAVVEVAMKMSLKMLPTRRQYSRKFDRGLVQIIHGANLSV